MAKCFALVNIRNMYFYKRYDHPGQRVAQGDAGMGQATRVDDDGVHAIGTGGMDAVDQRSFVVALKARQCRTSRLRLRLGRLFDIGQGAGAVDLRLPGAQQIQVGAVQEEEFFCHGS